MSFDNNNTSTTPTSYQIDAAIDEETSLLSANSGSVSRRPRRRKGRNNGGDSIVRHQNSVSGMSNKNNNNSNGESTTEALNQMHIGMLWNRFLLILVLGVFIGIAVYFQRYMAALQQTLAREQMAIDNMHEQLLVHQQVIDRFNASVTNGDVLNQLSDLKSDLSSTKENLQSQLNKAQVDIAQQLNQTLKELSLTVTLAEKEISDEVEKVKKDVEHYVVATQDQFSMENSFMVYQLAGTFTLLSCLISMWHMTAHLRKMNQPDVQRKILAILWMSPIYAITSWFSLVFHSAEGYLAIVKDGYEAYIIYQFLSFCISVLGKGDRHAVVELLAGHANHLTPPFRLCGICEYCFCRRQEPMYENDRALANAILLQCQLFAMQFVFFRPLTTTAMVIFEQMNYYGAGTGPTDYRSPQFYLTIVQNLSIFTAFTGLLKFYHAVDKELQWCRPFAKFLCIKGVVFMTFWQGLAISVLGQTTDVGGQDAEEWAKSAQNFLICLEMLLFSIAHFYCFPTDEWEEGYRAKASKEGKFGDSLALGDFLSDLKLIVRSNVPRKRKSARKNLTLPEVEEEDEEPESGSSAEFESVGSETQALTIDTGLSDDERVAYMLEKHLGSVGNDEDIILAKQRLLESGILSPDFFDDSDSAGGNMSVGHAWSDDEKSVLDDDEENFLDESSAPMGGTPLQRPEGVVHTEDALSQDVLSPITHMDETSVPTSENSVDDDVEGREENVKTDLKTDFTDQNELADNTLTDRSSNHSSRSKRSTPDSKEIHPTAGTSNDTHVDGSSIAENDEGGQPASETKSLHSEGSSNGSSTTKPLNGAQSTESATLESLDDSPKTSKKSAFNFDNADSNIQHTEPGSDEQKKHGTASSDKPLGNNGSKTLLPEFLRPSIFTTVATIAESERDTSPSASSTGDQSKEKSTSK